MANRAGKNVNSGTTSRSGGGAGEPDREYGGSFSGRSGDFGSAAVAKGEKAGAARITRQATPRAQANAKPVRKPITQPVRGSATKTSAKGLQNEYGLFRRQRLERKN